MAPHDTPRPLRFVFRGQVVEIPRGNPQQTVLQWLREDQHACGTKEGCAEGDCGACTVIVAELAEAAEGSAAVQADGLALRTVNACIRFLPTLDGKALLTVEDLAPPDGPLHPAQDALARCHGSQCGFCTPGFTMTLAAFHEHHARAGTQPSRTAVSEALSGNLCRCTGYRPIVDAGLQMLPAGGSAPALPVKGLREQLQSLHKLHSDHTLHWPHNDTPFWAPRSEDDLAALRLAHPDARLVAGATDVGLWVTKQMRTLPGMIWLGDVAGLRQMNERADNLLIGAGVPLEDAWKALARHWPTLTEMGQRFAGPPVRHAGTLVGNLANGSPIGDAAPVLMALGASLHLRRGDEHRSLLLQDFYLDYMKNQLQRGEFITAVSVPLDTRASAPPGQPGWQVQVHKLSKRWDCDISAVSAGFALQLEGTGDAARIADVRLAFGGMAGIVKRAVQTEAALRGQPWTEATLKAAQAALAHDFSPLSDLRASSQYRQQGCAALLQRLWLATRPLNPLPASAWRITAIVTEETL